MLSAQCLFFPPFHLDLTTESLWYGSQCLPLRPKAWALLRYLVENSPRLITQAELLEAIWQREYVSDGLLRGSIRELRRVLQDEATAPRFIETVSGRGYRFIAPVTGVATSTPLPVLEVSPQPPRSALPAPVAPQSSPTPVVLAEEYKLVTILCGALAEAPALAAQLGPEHWYRLLQTVVGLAQEVLQHYAGTLILVTNEDFTAVFGAPVAQEDHARRAVLAALDLRQRLHASPALHAQLAGGVLVLSMGLHSGLVVVGGLGQDPQRLATAVGAPLHVATRLQQQAAPGTILLSAATYALVHAEVHAEACGTLTLDGPSSPAPVYTVQGLLGRHAGVAGRGPGAASPFVGRERELALLHDCLAAVRTGQGQVVGLVGEPGMGKTRLVTEFCRSLAGQAVAMVVGQCLSYGQATPYLPVRDLLRQLCGLAEGDTAVQHRLHASGITAEEDVALLLHLLDLPVVPECLARLSPEARQMRTFALLRHLVVHAAQPQPLVLVVENVHWIDPTSAAWLLSLVERLAGATILLVGTCRPGSPLPWGAHTAGTQMALPPLRDPDSRAVVQAVPGAAALPEARLQALLAQAEGNPFFLEELAWHAMEHDQPDAPDAVPETVLAVLAARLDRLPPAAKRLLQVAAVIGMDVSLPLLQALAEQHEERLQQSLAHLQAAEFLYETRLLPEPAYTFKHALTQEVAYTSLLLEQRRVLHARLVEAIKVLAPERVAEQVDRLAHHALRGQVWDKALMYCRQAGAKAFAGFAYREAMGCCEQALEALAHLPTDRTTLEQAVDLRIDLAMALQPFGHWEQMLPYLRDAATLAAELGDQRRLGRAYHRLALTLYDLQDYAPAQAYAQQARAIGIALGDIDLQVGPSQRIGQIYHSLGDYRQAMTYLQQTLTVPQGEQHSASYGMTLNSVNARVRMVQSLTELGEFAVAATYGDEALQMAEAGARPYERLTVYWLVGSFQVRQGTLPQAIRLLERALAFSQDAHIPLQYRLAAPWLALAYALAGRATDALRLLGQVEENPVVCGEAYLIAGDVEDAHRLAQQSLANARHRKRRGEEARALWLLGEIAMRRAPPDVASAEVHYQQTLALAKALGMRPLQVHCHYGLGMLYHQTGRSEQARGALSTATVLYRDMEMTFWPPRAEAALAQVA